jgi:hypothetical protein
MTLIGKGRKLRVIALDPYGGYDLMYGLPAYAHKQLLFWHGEGESYKNFASQFAGIVERTEAFAKANGVDFRPFRFHDLRHLHAVEWLKDGRSIYDLQNRLGHRSIKTTEMYCTYLTPEAQRAAKGLAPALKATITPALKVAKSIATMTAAHSANTTKSLKRLTNFAAASVQCERVSKPPPSATRPPLQTCNFKYLGCVPRRTNVNVATRLPPDHSPKAASMAAAALRSSV